MLQFTNHKPKKEVKHPPSKGNLSFIDQRPKTGMQLQQKADSSHRYTQLKRLQGMADHFTGSSNSTVQTKVNHTGLPDNLKSGIENLSGYSMNDVRVHYNSSKPAQLQAHAFAQGNQIHIASGQERHLPHEAWHVVQQKQGRVKATRQLKEVVAINDDEGLEKEADVMGARALQLKNNNYSGTTSFQKEKNNIIQRKLLTKDGAYSDSAKLPHTEKENKELTSATNSAQSWLVENNKEIQAIGSAKGGQLVGPNVHIIGEEHDASQWPTIKKKWAYSGKITYEDLADSDTVKSSETAHHLKTDPDRKAENILENLHAKNITNLVIALYGARRFKSIYSNMKTHLEKDETKEVDKMEKMASELRTSISSHLNDFGFYWKMDYVATVKNTKAKAQETRSYAEKVLVHLMDTYGVKITADLKKIAENPIGMLTFRASSKVSDLKVWIDYADELIKNIEMVIELLHSLIEEETQPLNKDEMTSAMTEQQDRISKIHSNSSDFDVLNSASPLREHFMILRLKAMGSPSIAVVGHAHRDNLKKVRAIPNDIYYNDYNDFVTKTTSKA